MEKETTDYADFPDKKSKALRHSERSRGIPLNYHSFAAGSLDPAEFTLSERSESNGLRPG